MVQIPLAQIRGSIALRFRQQDTRSELKAALSRLRDRAPILQVDPEAPLQVATRLAQAMSKIAVAQAVILEMHQAEPEAQAAARAVQTVSAVPAAMEPQRLIVVPPAEAAMAAAGLVVAIAAKPAATVETTQVAQVTVLGVQPTKSAALEQSVVAVVAPAEDYPTRPFLQVAVVASATNGTASTVQAVVAAPPACMFSALVHLGREVTVVFTAAVVLVKAGVLPPRLLVAALKASSYSPTRRQLLRVPLECS